MSHDVFSELSDELTMRERHLQLMMTQQVSLQMFITCPLFLNSKPVRSDYFRFSVVHSDWLLTGLTRAVSMVTAYLSCRGVGASCLGGASPSELLGQEASPLEDPLVAACLGEGPSYL